MATQDASQNRSHGRGGAGNINNKPGSALKPDELSTPVLKGATYTTGRGGSGNIVDNDNPASARAAQDVETPAHHEKEARGTYHWGRGGEGNMVTVGKSGAQEAREKSVERRAASHERKRPEHRRGSSNLMDAIEKGKEMLGLGGKKPKEEAKPAQGTVATD